jgi:hypothetical protein
LPSSGGFTSERPHYRNDRKNHQSPQKNESHAAKEFVQLYLGDILEGKEEAEE